MTENSTTYTVEQLERAGGKLWEKDQMRRVYFNSLDERVGFRANRYNTGNISSAYLGDQQISNSQGRKIAGALRDMKVWYDLGDGEFHFKAYSRDDLAQRAIEQIKAQLEA